jgi:hypothetical protein
MNYAITTGRKGEYKLVRYIYNWNSDSFTYELGTTDKTYRCTDELDFKIVANLFYNVVELGGFLNPTIYPSDNTLTVKFEKDKYDPILTPEYITRLKGFKKFFGNKNINSIEYGD